MDAARQARIIVDVACRRSFRRGFSRWPNVRPGEIAFMDASGKTPYKFVPPAGSKIIVFGTPAANLEAFGLKADSSLPSLENADQCPPCENGSHHAASPGAVHWQKHPLTENLAFPVRPLARYDYSFEWNNLGFGRIGPAGSIWGIEGGGTCAGARELAGIYLENGAGSKVYAGSFMALLDLPQASILWCARPVGPVDSVEWSIIENFISSWRPDELPCWPVLRQTPAGYSALVTMRLDCDEDVASARELFDFYASEKIPFSLAIKTSLPMNAAHLRLMEDVNAEGGAILSHSHKHEYGWGASYGQALQDARASRQWFRDNFPQMKTPVNAVSPFHSNPVYAARALGAAGFEGMVGGIIRNDPQFLTGRAGKLPFADILGMSQQAMLHGDCVKRQQGIEVYACAFQSQHAARGIFGYLDHPFSDRYQYGWTDEAERIASHRELIARMREFPGVLFWNEDQCFDFLKMLDGIGLSLQKDRVTATLPREAGEFRPVCLYKGEEREL